MLHLFHIHVCILIPYLILIIRENLIIIYYSVIPLAFEVMKL